MKLAEVMSSSNPPHTTHVRALLRGWAKRYGPSEIAGALAAYIGYFTVLGMTQNQVASAYGGSIGESLAFLEFSLSAALRLIKPGQSAA